MPSNLEIKNTYAIICKYGRKRFDVMQSVEWNALLLNQKLRSQGLGAVSWTWKHSRRYLSRLRFRMQRFFLAGIIKFLLNTKYDSRTLEVILSDRFQTTTIMPARSDPRCQPPDALKLQCRLRSDLPLRTIGCKRPRRARIRIVLRPRLQSEVPLPLLQWLWRQH